MDEQSRNGVVPPEDLAAMLGQPTPEEEEGEAPPPEEQVGDDLIERPEPRQPTILPQMAAAAGRAGAITGGAARGLMEQLGTRIQAPAPPDDDLSDLFEGPDMDRDNDVYIKDVVTVSEEDVFGDGGADMSDILEVSEEDVMGDEEIWNGQGALVPEQRPRVALPRRSSPSPYSGLAGLQG